MWLEFNPPNYPLHPRFNITAAEKKATVAPNSSTSNQYRSPLSTITCPFRLAKTKTSPTDAGKVAGIRLYMTQPAPIILEK